jgi:hypothetical protein
VGSFAPTRTGATAESEHADTTATNEIERRPSLGIGNSV